MLHSQSESARTPEHISERGAGDEWQVFIREWKSRSEAEPLESFTSKPIDCKKTPLLSVQVHFILDGIGYQLYDIIQQQKVGATAQPPFLKL